MDVIILDMGWAGDYMVCNWLTVVFSLLWSKIAICWGIEGSGGQSTEPIPSTIEGTNNCPNQPVLTLKCVGSSTLVWTCILLFLASLGGNLPFSEEFKGHGDNRREVIHSTIEGRNNCLSQSVLTLEYVDKACMLEPVSCYSHICEK